MTLANSKWPAVSVIAIATALNLGIQIIAAMYFLSITDGFERPWLIAVAIVVEVLAFLVIAPFLQGVYKMSNVRLNLPRAAKHTLAGFSFAKLLAFGDYLVWRTLLKRENKPIAPAFDFAILLYVSGIGTLLTLFVVAQIIMLGQDSPVPINATLSAVSKVPLFVTGFILVLFLIHKTHKVRNLVQSFFIKVFGKKAETPFAILARLKVSVPTVSFWIALLFASWLLESIVFYFCILAVGLDVSFVVSFYDYTFVRIFQFLPFLPGGFGEIEAASNLILLPYGYNSDEITIAALLFRFVSFWIPFFMLMILSIGAILTRRIKAKAI